MFCLIVVTFVATSPITQAQATATWPLQVEDMAVYGVDVDKDESLTLSSCRQGGSYNSSTLASYIDKNQVVRNMLEPFGDKQQQCDTYGAGSINGILLSYYPRSSTTSVLTARKNNRQIWEVSTSSLTDCDPLSGFTKFMYPASVSVGGDGNIYMILTHYSGDSAMACPERLFGVNTATGAVIMDQALTTPSVGTYNKTQAWTYDNHILVLDRSGTLHKFEYDGDEITNSSYPYTFTPGSGRMFYQSAANAEGTVYAVSASTTSSAPITLLYHKNGGSTGSIYNSAHPSSGVTKYTFDKDGNFISINPTNMDIFDISTNTVSTSAPNPISGYVETYVIDYVEDTNGNGLLYRIDYNSAGTANIVSVDVIDAATGIPTNHPIETGAGNSMLTAMPLAGIDRAIENGYMYVSMCKDQSSGCGNGNTPPDSWIYRVSVSGFGQPVPHGYTQFKYESEELQYVAMGDSYSSGEGNPDYNPWTDASGTNQCHRSLETSYPQWLEEHGDLNLELADYVACSGATTDTLLSGGFGDGAWGEPAQIKSLSSKTDRITLTIGGNDLGFAQVLRECIKNPLASSSGWGCSTDSTLIEEVENRLSALDGTNIDNYYEPENGRLIHSIQSVVEEIAEKSPDALIYIGGYPRLFGASSNYYDVNASAPGGYQCSATAGATVAYDDAQWLNDQADALNQIIETAVLVAKADGIDVTYVSPALFSGHRLCDAGTPYIHGVELLSDNSVSPASMHPNNAGQTIAYSLMFQSAME